MDPGEYQYPNGFINLLAVTFLVPGLNRAGEATARGIAALSGLLIVVPAFLLGWRVDNRRTGLVAALFTAFCFLFVVQGRTPGPDALQLLLAAWSLYFLLRHPRPTATDVVWCGLFGGLAVGTKYTALINIIPAFFVCCWSSDLKKGFQTFAAWASSLLIAFAAATPAFFIRMPMFVTRVKAERLIQKTGGFDFSGPGWFGYLFGQHWAPSDAPFSSSLVQYAGWPFVVLGLAALPWLIWESTRRRDRRLLAICVSIVTGYFFFSFASKIQAIRFLLITVFLWSVAAAMALDALSSLANTRKAWLLALGVVAVIAPNISLSAEYLGMMSQPDTRLVTAFWAIKNIPSDEPVLNFMYGPALPASIRAVSWPMPEYGIELERPFVGPSMQRLASEKIRWVIWNDFYSRKFFGAPRNETEARYFKQWLDFYADLKTSAQLRFEASSKISPAIQVYWLPS